MNHGKLKLEKVADFGVNEPFMARIVCGLPEILDATDHSGKERIKEEIMEMFMNGLAPAFRSLQEIRRIESGKKEKLLMDLRKEYFSFYDRLWAAYKDRMQKVATALGYDIGFIFVKDEIFEEKAKYFQNKYPEIPVEVITSVKKNRACWQRAVVKFRNDYAQHQTVLEKDVKELFSLNAAEICFKNCWTMIEMILVHLICTKLYGGIGVKEIPEKERDSTFPKRFQIVMNIRS